MITGIFCVFKNVCITDCLTIMLQKDVKLSAILKGTVIFSKQVLNCKFNRKRGLIHHKRKV